MTGNRPFLLLDTDIFINFLRGQQEEAHFFKRVFVDHEFNGCFSPITELELFAVDRMSGNQEEQIERLLGSLQRIEIDSAVARLAGKLLTSYRHSKGLEMPDAIIAASAICNGAALVTKNTRHFAYLPGLVISTPSAWQG